MEQFLTIKQSVYENEFVKRIYLYKIALFVSNKVIYRTFHRLLLLQVNSSSSKIGLINGMVNTALFTLNSPYTGIRSTNNKCTKVYDTEKCWQDNLPDEINAL